MKKHLQILLLTFVSFVLTDNIQSQTITVSDFGNCFSDDVFTLNGTSGGKNRYTANIFGADNEIIWDNGRWEIRLVSNPSPPSHTNDNPSTPNPPCLAFGGWTNENVGCSDLSTFDGTGCQNFLPIELSQFYSNVHETKIELRWKTETEMNNEGFHIERSIDGINFKSLGFVRGQGNSNQTYEYDFVDERPLKGVNYYRLKQIDFDGAFDYSDVVSADFSKSRQLISLSPNPVQRGSFTLSFPENDAATVEMTMYDYTGRLVRQTQPVGLQTNINVEDLEKGIYLIRVDTDGVAAWERVVVQ